MDDHKTSSESPGIVANGVGYDPSEINAPGVTLFTLVVVGVILAVFFGVTLYYEKFATELTYQRVDEAPNTDLMAIHARENSQLSTYKMLDKSKGVVQIPIDQAMKELLAEGPGKAYSNKDQTVRVEGAPGAAGAAAPAAPGAPVKAAGMTAAAPAPAAVAPVKKK